MRRPRRSIRFSLRSLFGLTALVAVLVCLYPVARDAYVEHVFFHSSVAPTWWPNGWILRYERLQGTYFEHNHDVAGLLEAKIHGRPVYTKASLASLVLGTLSQANQLDIDRETQRGAIKVAATGVKHQQVAQLLDQLATLLETGLLRHENGQCVMCGQRPAPLRTDDKCPQCGYAIKDVMP